jgi:hypothetical protein
MLTPTHAWAGAPRHREPAVLSGMSDGEHCRKEETAAKEQGEADTAKNRENAVPAIGRLGVGRLATHRARRIGPITTQNRSAMYGL